MTDEERREKKRAYNAAYSAANRDAIAAKKAAYYRANRETILNNRIAYHAANKEKRLAYATAYRAADPLKVRAAIGHLAARRRELDRTGVSSHLEQAEIDAILALYAERSRLTDDTGVQHDVDHILPLTDGGRHKLSNLQILTEADHRVKTQAEARARLAVAA